MTVMPNFDETTYITAENQHIIYILTGLYQIHYGDVQ